MCECNVCVRYRAFEDRLQGVPIEHQEYFRTLYDTMTEIEMDRDYYKVIVDGTWPNADEVIKHIRQNKSSR